MIEEVQHTTGGKVMKIEIRIDGEPEQIARFLRAMATQRIIDLAGSEALPTREEVEAWPIEKLELSVRPYNLLKIHGIETVGELASRVMLGRIDYGSFQSSRDYLLVQAEDGLRRIPNCGPRCAEEVVHALAKLGLHLHQADSKGLPVDL